MAIDKNETRKLLEEIDTLFEDIAGQFLSTRQKEMVKSTILGPALAEIRRIVTESRSPKIYLIGRSGDGKSSLINALVGKHAVETSDVRRGQTTSARYNVLFPEAFASWDFYDSRGIFDPDITEGETEETAIEFLKRDLLEKQPDVILHVIAAKSIRNLACDINAVKEIDKHLRSNGHTMPRTLLVVSQVDLLGDRMKWPPEDHPQKSGQIMDALDYLSKVMRVNRREALDLNSPLYGYRIMDDTYVGVIPVCAFMELSEERDDRWNIETLKDFIGHELPEVAQLNYYQAQRRKDMLMKMSTALIKRFSTIAAGIGAVPIPVPDIIILTPLQVLMVAVVAGLSCRHLSTETAREFIAAAGVNVGAAFALRETARQLIKLVPFKGSVVSAGIAGSSTYGIGKAAEAYFFSGKKIDPQRAASEWKS